VNPGVVVLVLPDKLSANASEKFVLSVFASAMLWTERVESKL